MLNKEKIKEALEYYDIKDADYQEKCERCIEEIKNNKKIQNKAKEIYEILYIDKTEKFRELWKEKDIEILFEEKINQALLLHDRHKWHIRNVRSSNPEPVHAYLSAQCPLHSICYRHPEEKISYHVLLPLQPSYRKVLLHHPL